MLVQHAGLNGVPLVKCARRLVSYLQHWNCFRRRPLLGNGSLLSDESGVSRNKASSERSQRDFHPAVSVSRAKSSDMEPKEITNAETETEKEQDGSVSESEGQEVKESRKKRKSEEPKEEHEGNKRGKKRKGNQPMKPGERYVPPPQKRNHGVSFNQEHFAETAYYFESGLRKVHPYYFDFKAYCKRRWLGKTLLEVFSSEFRAEPLDYYRKAAKEGRIRLNEIPVGDLDITLKNNDLMRNTVHRHEPPVNGQPLQILVDDGEVVVVDKPASLPVHPCGRYRHNTVIFILGKENGLCGLHTVHRLDRLTSGILLFARTLEMSKKLDQMVRDRQMEKEYVCRVKGEFPDNEVVCEEPILVVSFKVGFCRVDPKGKPSRTVFQKLGYNGRSSVVRCLPLTGRTHQIRVHLQYLGFPILNDPIYGSSAWGPNRGKGGLVGKNDQELLEALIEEHHSKESLHLLDISDELLSGKSQPDTGTNGDALVNNVLTAVAECENTACEESTTNDKEADLNSTQVESSCQNEESSRTANETKVVRDHLCSECKIVRPDPTEKELVMYLHALRYKGPDFEYSTQMPDWAKEDWVQD